VNSAIRTENLSKRFRKVDALSGLNLDITERAIYALVGPNGAGKTTTIKILMNLLRPTGGAAEILGIDSRKIAARTLASIGYVSENQELPLWMTVAAFLGYLRPFYPTWDRRLEEELIQQFELPPERKLKDLSRGMRMKAALAGSLAYHPKLIILDEPFSGLDPLVRDQLIEGLLKRASESTILISSHDLAEVESFASHVGYMEQGQLRFSEELSTLRDRFREVELKFEEIPSLPEKWPAAWMQTSNSGPVIRFVESQFSPERTHAEIRQLLGEAKDVTFTAMTLRSIFLAMAKSGSRNVAEEQR
jgi:ABC-2 type transport system ATP-binding protein